MCGCEGTGRGQQEAVRPNRAKLWFPEQIISGKFQESTLRIDGVTLTLLRTI